MGLRISLIINNGNFSDGFPGVKVEIYNQGNAGVFESIVGNLPSSSIIPDCYEQWRLNYSALGSKYQLRRVRSVTQGSESQRKACWEQLKDSLNKWLNSELFKPIREKLRTVLRDNLEDEIFVLICTDNVILRKLPWDSWDLFEGISRVEIGLGCYGTSDPLFSEDFGLSSQVKQVRILGILGDSEGIDVSADRDTLGNISGARIVFRQDPSHEDFEVFWHDRWDIVCFSGHSESVKNSQEGLLKINRNDNLSIGEIKATFEEAINKGLQLAIFNSCDGLGLAQELAPLGIPHVIVWREPVPDKVAEEFLRSFLRFFSSGLSLSESMRKAKIKLRELARIKDPQESKKKLEDLLPGVTHLPILVEGRRGESVTWNQLRGLTGEGGREKSAHGFYLLDKVKKEVDPIWSRALSIERSMSLASPINLNKELQPDQVQPINDVRMGRTFNRMLPEYTNIIDVIDHECSGGHLLILGEPGGGKTLNLLSIARELIERAMASKTEPIPVILNLSSWLDDQQTIGNWVVGELTQKYGKNRQYFNRKILQEMLDSEQIVLLLDGLDELAPARQEKCVRAINRFLKDYSPKYLVVCSRREDYERYKDKTPLKLRMAVYLKELQEKQIEKYLEELNCTELGYRIETDSSLKKLAQCPFFLRMMAVAFGKDGEKGELSMEEWNRLNDDNERRNYLFNSYLKNMLKFPFDNSWYAEGQEPTTEQTLLWLKWLAKKLKSNYVSEFFVERLQLSWLSKKDNSIYYLFISLIFGGIFALVGWSVGGTIAALVFGIIFAVSLGFLNRPLNKYIDFFDTELNWFSGLGIWRFPAISGVFLLLGCFLGGIIGSLWGGVYGETIRGLLTGMIAVGFLWSLSQGGTACIQYFGLRLGLFLGKHIPWNYRQFLEYATARMLLQKPRGGYQFLHNLHQEHLANMSESEIRNL